MKTLREALERYLSLRRGLGAALRGPGGHLHRFVEFLEGEGAAGITCQLEVR